MDDIYQVVIHKPPKDKQWFLTVTIASNDTDCAIRYGPFKSAKNARIAADKHFPTLCWISSRKGYTKVSTDVDTPPWD